MKKEYLGKLDTDEWADPIVDGWPVDMTPFVGKRVRILIEEVGEDPESYENLAKSFECK